MKITFCFIFILSTCSAYSSSIVVWDENFKIIIAQKVPSSVESIISKLNDGKYLIYYGDYAQESITLIPMVADNYDLFDGDFLWHNGNNLTINVEPCTREQDTLPDGKWCLLKNVQGRINNVYEKNVANGLLDGEFKHWHENGNLQYRYVLKNGIRADTARSYFENGKILSQTVLIDSCQGISEDIRYWENGKIHQYYNKNLMQIIRFDPQGRIISSENVNIHLVTIGQLNLYSVRKD